jgi:hypothetical protein
VDGASTDAGSRSQAHALQDCYQSEPPAVRSPDSDTKREEMLAQGRALAASVLVQYERFTRCPHNLQESKHLEYMQDQFLKWEREAVECDIPTRKEFPDPRLRPVIKIVVERSYISERRAHAQAMSIWKTADECDGPRAPFRLARKQYRSESGFWSGMPGGI